MVADATRRASARVMGSDACVVTVGPVDPRLGLARLDELEQRWSRFLPDSDISRLNRAGGTACAVHPDTLALVDGLVSAWHHTAGGFDPTLLGALVDLGYETSRSDPSRRTSLEPDVAHAGDAGAVLMDAAAGVVQLPRGTTLDPGGLGKGLAADLIVAELLAQGADGALVEIGGDLRAAGRAPHPRGWVVALDDTDADGPDGPNASSIVISDGGVATSTTSRRRWTANGETRHHLLDPATGTCTDSPVTTCTVIAGTGALAETFTKPAFILSPAATIEMLDGLGLAGRLTLRDGRVLCSAAWPRFASCSPTPLLLAEGRP